MLKLNKMTLLVLSTLVVGCANIDDSYQATKQDFQQYEALTQQYHVKENWWSLYQDPQLNQLVEQALENNKNLQKAAIAVNKALYHANLLGANLVPSFSAKTGVGSSAAKNIETGGHSKISHFASLELSYTLDLWRRLTDSASAAEWNYKATQQDLAAARLSLINAVVSTYYQIAYLNGVIATSEESVKYYSQISRIMQNRFKLGVADSVSINQAQQAVLNAQNSLINYQTQRKMAEQTLRNFLNLKPQDPLQLTYPDILNVKTVGVNLNVPVSTIANRPDIKSTQFRLNAAFKDAKAMQKSWFPSITLGASLSSSGNLIRNALENPIAAGTIGINLPFLNWHTVRWNVKISEANYETAKLSFEQSITTALNEIDTYYYSYQQAKAHFENMQKTYNNNKRITQYYKNRYDVGVAQLRDWLNASNAEKMAQMGILNAKYQLIQRENTVYSAMAGYYSPTDK
ncbi:toxin/drug exporter TdeA [Pasteurella sp. PK-2025]|uniref:toxin/drug exporter TdeA n=1 Tax=unclassified Pasteurella TaxID=2621516 RepID=UPI003C76C542